MAWWQNEQPSKEIKQYVEQQLNDNNWKVDVVFKSYYIIKI